MGQPGFSRSQPGRRGSSGPAARARPARGASGRGSSRRVRAPRRDSGSRGAVRASRRAPPQGAPASCPGARGWEGRGCRGWTPFPLAAPRERHGAFSLAQPWNQPFSRDSGDNLCFPAPRVRAGAGAGLAQGPGAAAALGTPRSRRALAACGGCGGPGCGPSSGGTLAARLRAQPARRSECHPGVLPGSPAHGLQFLTGGISPSWELQGWPGCWAGEIWACGASGCKDSVPSCTVSSWLRVPVSDTDIILFSFLFWRALWLIYL